MHHLVVLEGLDGSGKSTQTAMLRKSLEQQGIPARQVKLPDYDSPSSSLVKMYLNGSFGTDPACVNAYAASSFYAVDRYANFHTKWESEYEQGTLILADRYTTSNASYQMTKLDASEWDSYLSWLTDFEYNKLGLPEPSLVIFLDMPIAVSQSLLEKRYDGDAGQKDVHERNTRYLNACRKAALYAADKWGWKIIPCAADGKARPADDVAADVLALTLRYMKEDNA